MKLNITRLIAFPVLAFAIGGGLTLFVTDINEAPQKVAQRRAIQQARSEKKLANSTSKPIKKTRPQRTQPIEELSEQVSEIEESEPIPEVVRPTARRRRSEEELVARRSTKPDFRGRPGSVEIPSVEVQQLHRSSSESSKWQDSKMFAKPENWQVFQLKHSLPIIMRFLENPSDYYGEFDLQEDLSVWSSARQNPDWVPIPWNELRRRYILCYPELAKRITRKNDRFNRFSVSPMELRMMQRSRYRVVEMK